ncbi:DsbA family protein [Flaviflexus huanghaiensis]|uniref:DsbA family protein n=1 Tax=Flaviflexus huanghaiensis TaxID=1111473 RepID=UPI0015F80444|nr:thioredoxin domain-containing protein [Flaviflexus huanghaiensis]
MAEKNVTKAERREAAREKARKLQEAEARRAKRNRNLTIGVIIAAIVLIGVVVWSIVSNGRGAADDDSSGRQEWDPVAVQVEPVVKDGTDITTGWSVVGEGAELATDANRVDIYFDYMCTYCNELEQMNGGDINDIVAAGDAEFVYHPVAILRNDFSAKGAAAFKYIAENSPEHLTAFHKNVFDEADAVLNNRASALPDWGSIANAARDAGVPEDIASSIEKEADLDWVNTATQSFLEDYRGTPTVLLNGTETTAWAANDFPALLGLAEPKATPTE